MSSKGLAICGVVGENGTRKEISRVLEKIRNVEPHLEKRTDRGNVYYTLFWSPLRKAEKFDIVRHVPALAGIYELYYMDFFNRLHMMCISRVWYGGLRSRLRHDTDPELVEDQNYRKILEKYDVYYRYTLTESLDDMLDVIHFFGKSYLPSQVSPDDSGRYRYIFLEEIAPDKMVTI